MKKRFIVLCIFGLMAGFITVDAQNTIRVDHNGPRSPEYIGRKLIADLLSRSEFMMYKSKDVKAVHYAEACTGFGAARLAGLLHDAGSLQKLTKRYAKVINENIENTANHVDANVYGILPLELYRFNHDKRFLDQGLQLADIQWKEISPDGLTIQTRFWIDDLWMIGSLQVQAYRLTGKTEYLEKAALEIDTYIRKLQQPNGLFFHGENAPFFWGRGNGWVAAGMAELLTELQVNNPHYSSIAAAYKKMLSSLLLYQADNGMWCQLIDHPESYYETSSTAMFGYAMAIGIKKGILPVKLFAPACQKAWYSLIKYINTKGKIGNVCVGTGQSKDLTFYLTRPTATGDLHGQAPVLWFAYSLLANYSAKGNKRK